MRIRFYFILGLKSVETGGLRIAMDEKSIEDDWGWKFYVVLTFPVESRD